MNTDNQSCANLRAEDVVKLIKDVIKFGGEKDDVMTMIGVIERKLEGSDKKEVECSFGNRCDKCRTIMTTTHKKDDINSDPVDQQGLKPSARGRLSSTTHKKDYVNLKNGNKIMIGKSKDPLRGFSTDILDLNDPYYMGGEEKDECTCYAWAINPLCPNCTSTHKKDIDVFMENKERLDKAISNKRNKELERLTDEMFKGSDKKDYPNVALSEKLMTGLTEKQYDKAVKE